VLDYYKLIRNSVQILDVELVSLECSKSENISSDANLGVNLEIQRKVELVDKLSGKIYLKAQFEAKHEDEILISISLVYKGICKNTSETLGEEDFKHYLYDQVVPLLLPYARECISSIMTKMKLSAFYIPTMDVLNSLKVNKEGDLVDEQPKG